VTAYNTWMPGDQTYGYNGGASLSYKYVAAPEGAKLLAEVFNVPDAQAISPSRPRSAMPAPRRSC
jgi:hypothetical protein